MPCRKRSTGIYETASKHTGAELKNLEVSFRIRDDQSHEKVQDFLERSDEVISLDEQGAPVDVWTVTQKSYSFQDGRRGYDYAWELLRKEDLNVEGLTVAGVEFKPYAYRESFAGDYLVATARVNLSREALDGLKKLLLREAPFTVVRWGISDEEREMRFGRTLLSEHGESFKVQFALVDRAIDDEPGKFDRDAERLANMRAALARTTEIMDGLLSLLASKGVITADEREGLESVSDERLLDGLLQFDMVDDLDAVPITS